MLSTGWDFIKEPGTVQTDWSAVRMTLPVSTWFDHLEGSFSYKKVHLEKFCLSVKLNNCLPAENINKTPACK